jgi:hypothetical protein
MTVNNKKVVSYGGKYTKKFEGVDSKNVIELGVVFERYNLNSDEEQPKTSNLVFDDIFAQTVLATQEMYPWCKKGMNIVKRRDQQYLWLGCCSETRRSNKSGNIEIVRYSI